MINIALLSRWHVHADGYANSFLQDPDVKITVVWDEEPDKGQEWARKFGVPFEPDLQKVLARADVDAVSICAPTNMHKDIIIAAAKAGKHIFTEKVLTTTLKDAKEVADVIKKSGVKFCISYPHRTHSHILYAKQIADSGVLGDINLLRVRNSHSGASDNWLPPHFYNLEQCGGGAMMDLGAHGMYLSRWFLGKPKKITSMFNSRAGGALEENAVCLIEFENKAIAINETSFLSKNSPFAFELYGTKGSLTIGGMGILLNVDQKLVIEKEQLPAAAPMPINQFLNVLKGTGDITFGIQDAVELTELMDRAYISYRENRMVEF